MPEPVFCPRCRSEFLASATRCAECDVALVLESALSDSAVDEMPPIESLVCIRAAAVGWAQGLSERLAAAGISHRIEMGQDDEDEGSVRRPGANLPYGVYVLPADVQAATQVDAAFTQYQIPDIPVTGEAGGCPACGTAVSETTTECPECGLLLLVEED